MNETELTTAAESALKMARVAQITSPAQYDEAANMLKEIKFSISKITTYWKPLKEAAAAHHKAIVAREKEMTKPLEEADQILRTGCTAFLREQERQRAEAERIAREADRERRRFEEEAERKAAEVRRLAEEAAKKDELDDDDVDILRMAQAEAVKAESEAVYAPVAPPPVPQAKVQGVSVRRVWKARVVDDKAVPVSMMGIMLRPVDMTALNKLAGASNGGAEVPGVEFYQEESMRVGY